MFLEALPDPRDGFVEVCWAAGTGTGFTEQARELGPISDSYTCYLTQTFRKAFNLQGTSLRIQYNVSENPYENAEDKPKKKPLRRISLSKRIEKREGRKEEKNRFKKKTKVSIKKQHSK